MGNEAGLPYHEVLRGRRESKGRRVREVWVEWAIEQPDPKPSWLVPYDELSEADKEADRRIGSALWGDGFMDGYNAGLEAAYQLSKAATSKNEGSGAIEADASGHIGPDQPSGADSHS